eukprot:g879.t1
MLMRPLSLLVLPFLLVPLIRANGIHDIDGNILPDLVSEAPEEIEMAEGGELGDMPPSIRLWSSLSQDEKKAAGGVPPYVPPADRKYNTTSGPVEGKINVHLVPHTHDDTGWQVTVDQYFFTEVYYVLDTLVPQLAENPDRRFMYVETGFFARWWIQQPEEIQNLTRKLVQQGQLEFINGGWCMHDEASPYWVAMVDQTTRGHQFLKKHFGPAANPRGTWQIDPFGHSNTQAWLLGAEAGMESLFWGRMDWQDREVRKNQSRLEWIWQGSKSLGKSAQIFAGQLYGRGTGGYSTWISWEKAGNCGDQVQDDPTRHDYNADQWVDQFISSAQTQAANTRTEHQLWALGGDFRYQNAACWYRNLDKLIHYVNKNGTINAFYSTPSHYVDAKKAANLTWEVRQDDIFPLADKAHHYWSGYFTSRPALKRQVRFATNFLNAARQLEVLSQVTKEDVNLPTTRPAPPVGDSWTDSLEGTVGVATHHDGMSGTERQDVSNDYEMRISESMGEAEKGVTMSLAKLLSLSSPSSSASERNSSRSGDDSDASPLALCTCAVAGAAGCLNMSMCDYTVKGGEGAEGFSLVAWNPLAHTNISQLLRIPITLTGAAGSWAVQDDAGATVPSQLVALDDRTHSLPIMYLNKANMSAAAIAQAQARLTNPATHELVFEAALPPLGYAVFTAKPSATAAAATPEQEGEGEHEGDALEVENDGWRLSFDSASGLLTSLTNKHSGVSTPLRMDWGWYNSSVGGCTDLSKEAHPSDDGCDSQASGAYIFRSNSSTLFYPGDPKTNKPSISVIKGGVVTEVRQRWSDWATHVIRLYAGQPYVEVEWTAGPIPVDTPWFPPVAHKGSGQGQGRKSRRVVCAAASSTASSTIGAADTSAINFVEGADGSNDCPAHARKLTYAECVEAAKALSTHMQPKNSTNPLDPGACFKFNSMFYHPVAPPSPDDKDALPNNWGKELVLRYSSGLKSNGVFYTDSNGKEMLRREYNKRGPSYPVPYNVSEPVAGNYYPVNAMMSLDDGKNELAILADVSQGGASLADGSLELMVHRRVQADDHRGIGAAPHAMGAHGHEGDGGCDCEGLTMRGRHWLLLDTVANAHEQRRVLTELLQSPPTLAFAKPGIVAKAQQTKSYVQQALPPSVKLVTLTSNYQKFNDGAWLLRLSHLYAVGEHPTLSVPVKVSLTSVFAKAGLSLVSINETSLTANQPMSAIDQAKFEWNTEPLPWPQAQEQEKAPPFEERFPLAADGGEVTLTIRPMEVRTFLARFK